MTSIILPRIRGTLVCLKDLPRITIEFISATKPDRFAVGDSAFTSAGVSTIIFYFPWNPLHGIPEAFQIWNHDEEKKFFLLSLKLDQVPNHEDIHFDCNSWVYPEKTYKFPRIFFANMSYLPSQTPEALRKYREQELKALRGDGTGQRLDGERIYDYATYNDLGNPDQDDRLARPVLGGSNQYPYPRRGRTGRPPTKKDPNSESPLPANEALNVYVPRDDKFSDQKLKEFLAYFPKSGINALKPFVKNAVEQQGKEFKSYEDMRDILFKNGFTFPVPPKVNPDGKLVLKFPIPSVIQDNLDGWITDQEFGREMLAGVNPNLIRLLKDFPPQVNLDGKVYGDQSTKITKEHLEKNLDGLSVDEALISKRLFILDHHDLLMPYLRRINEIEFEAEISKRKCYATRTILLLKDDGTLKPLAIELSLPHPDQDQFGAVSEVYTPEDGPLWLLAKGYVVVNDSSYHQLVSHWLNTHAVVEPFVISANRQLSALHPIYKLLHPHFKDTMFINALARNILINAEGIIETSFLLGKYCIEFTSMHYENWVFPEQALPTDLIKRGMAIEDPTKPHGLRLLIEDYPYADDGLEIWAAIEKWVKDYVNYYYGSDDTIKEDSELQAWWKELVEVGHADLKDKPWWPKMQTRKDLIDCCTIIIWISSALHAAINFGQFPYGGYIVNRPTLSRRLIPQKGTPEYDELVKNPEVGFLKTITPKLETLLDLSIIEILSGHTSDEVYLGTRNSVYWTYDEKPLVALEEFNKTLAKIEDDIIRKNNNPSLKNRRGPVNLPYTLLYRSSEQGMTFKGIPNSISI